MRVVRFIAWIAVVLLCALAFARAGSVLALAVGLALLVAPFVGWIAASRVARKLDVRLGSATTVGKSDQIGLTVSIRNPSRLPAAPVLLKLRAANLLTTESLDLPLEASCAPHATTDVAVEFSAELCGRIELCVDGVRVFEPFRLFSRTVSCQAQRRLTVMPELYDVQLRNLYAVSPLSDTTVFSPYVKGSDLSEVFGLRDYEAGDELKRIHWKLSEKLDQTIVRDPSLPLDNSVLLFWDKCLPSGATDGAKRADAMAEVVLALMEQLARADVSFEVASNDIPASRCLRAFATDEGDIYELVGQLLSNPVAPAAQSGLAEYVRFFGTLTCSRLLYICAERPADLDALLGSREALLFICDGGSDMVARGSVTELHFASDGVLALLQMAGVV